jgi:DNA helicase-2/ATP-dependent DNA helicase PcrA
MLFGSTDYYPPSRFLAEIPEDLVHAHESGRPRGRGSEHRAAVAEAAIAAGAGGSSRAPVAASGPVGARGAERLGLRVGDDVEHEKFGEGVILELIGDGDKTEVVVHFRDIGEKRLLLAWAPLQKIRG